MGNKGYLRIYTDNVQGKIIVVFWLTLRALETGKSVFIGLFVKSIRCNEAYSQGVLSRNGFDK